MFPSYYFACAQAHFLANGSYFDLHLLLSQITTGKMAIADKPNAPSPETINTRKSQWFSMGQPFPTFCEFLPLAKYGEGHMLYDLAFQPRGIHGLHPEFGRRPDKTRWWHPCAIRHCYIGLQLPHLLIHITQANLQEKKQLCRQAKALTQPKYPCSALLKSQEHTSSPST